MDFLKQKVDNLKIIVFDLDYTLWPFWADTHVCRPFRINGNGKVIDANGHNVKPYPEVTEVLNTLKSMGYTLGIASRTTALEEAEDLLRLFNWDQLLTYKQIYPGTKKTHFEKISEESGVEFKEMLFFDDETRNIRDLKSKGVVSVLVKDGLSKQVVRDAIKSFVNQNN